jgi:probable rRNA maturation factor
MTSANSPDSDDEPNPSHSAGLAAANANGDRSPEVLLIVRQRRIRADWAEVESYLADLCAKVARRPFTVCITSDRVIRQYNRQYRSQDKATDVLSFPAGADTAGENYLGDIVVSAETARDNAAHHGLRLEEEIKILALHGVLHLLGYDHESDNGQMARAEKTWARKLGLAANLTGRSRQAVRRHNTVVNL